MKKLILLAFILSGYNLFSQTAPNSELFINSGGATNLRFTEIKPKKGEIKGSVYLSDEWRIGSIKLNSGEVIEDMPLKYDIKSSSLEIKTSSGNKELSLYHVDKFEWINGFEKDVFVNCRHYMKDNNEIAETGVFRILSEGRVTLFHKTNLGVLSSNYNVALNAGNQSDQYVPEEIYYVYIDKKLMKLKNNKSSVLEVLNDKGLEIEAFVKANKLKYRKAKDLQKIFNYYNSID